MLQAWKVTCRQQQPMPKPMQSMYTWSAFAAAIASLAASEAVVAVVAVVFSVAVVASVVVMVSSVAAGAVEAAVAALKDAVVSSDCLFEARAMASGRVVLWE